MTLTADPGDITKEGSPFIVTFDDDGGLTIREKNTHLVISIITNPRHEQTFIEAWGWGVGQKARVEEIPAARVGNPVFAFWVQDPE